MRQAVINWTSKQRLVVVREEAVQICDGDHCAAMLLAVFEYWHNIKMEMVPKADHMNKLARQVGETGTNDTSLLQGHTEKELSENLLGIYGVKSIRAALAFLLSKKFISRQKNPNPRYGFDRTHYFLLNIPRINLKIKELNSEDTLPKYRGKTAGSEFAILPDEAVIDDEDDSISEAQQQGHTAKTELSYGDSALSYGKNAVPYAKNAAAITEISSEISSRDVYKREDKSANEISFAPAPQGFLQHNSDEDQQPKRLVKVKRPGRRCPSDFEVSDEMREWAAERFPSVDVDAETEKFRDHEYARTHSDWNAVWRSWIRKAVELQQRTPHPGYQRSANGYQARGAAAPAYRSSDPIAEKCLNLPPGVERMRASHSPFKPLTGEEEHYREILTSQEHEYQNRYGLSLESYAIRNSDGSMNYEATLARRNNMARDAKVAQVGVPEADLSPEETPAHYMGLLRGMVGKISRTMDMDATLSRENRPRRLGIVQGDAEDTQEE